MSSERMTAEQIREEAARKAGGWIGPLALILPMADDVFREARDSLTEMHVAYMTELDAARRLGVEATKDAITTSAEASALRAERDTLAAALASIREPATSMLEWAERNHLFVVDRDFFKKLRTTLSALPADLAAERDARVRAEAVEEREGDMHARIRAEYDRTIANSWRAANAKLADERDAAVARAEEAEHAIDSWRSWDESFNGGVRGYVAALEADQRRLVVAEQERAISEERAEAAEARCAALREAYDRWDVLSRAPIGKYDGLSVLAARDAVTRANADTAAAAEAWTRETRARALGEARDAIEMAFGHDEDVSAQDVIDRLLGEAAAIREGRE